jgi:hypothetical protein
MNVFFGERCVKEFGIFSGSANRGMRAAAASRPVRISKNFVNAP